MRKFKYVITDKLGIHARPAGVINVEAKKYESVITLKCGERTADATRLMAVMGLGAKMGMEVTVCADGKDEVAALGAMEKIFKENL